MRTIGAALLACGLLALAACGGGNMPSSSSAADGTLSGNWQMNLLQQEPRPETLLSVSGFLVESNNVLTGSVQVPPVSARFDCGGVSALTGTVSGQNVTLSVNEGGTAVNFTGGISQDGKSMSGNYQAEGGGCFTRPTTGTWNAFLVPPLTGNFTGTINSAYMQILQAASNPVPVTVSGTITQSTNAGTSNATLTGTIKAVGYPCFSSAALSGTISGQNVYLNVFGYNGNQIGTLGQPGTVGAAGSPATVVVESGGISLVDTSSDGLFLGAFTGTGTVGPCPPLIVPGTNSTQTSDSGSVALKFH